MFELAEDEVVVVPVPFEDGRFDRFVPEARQRELELELELATLRPEARLAKLCCEGVLRAALGPLLGLAPVAVDIRRTEKGKPFVNAPIGFSVSHAERLGVIALSRRPEVGVDLEAAARPIDVDALLEGFFPDQDRAELLETPTPLRRRATLLAYTRFEAAVKATGVGLTVPAQDYEVLARGLHYEKVELGPNWVCSVVATAPRFSVRRLEVSELFAL